ncbi:hypothetical protein VPHD484_0380 [Vibrio phage D484]
MKTLQEFLAEATDVTYGVSGSLFSGSMERERHRNTMAKLGAKAVPANKRTTQDNEWVVSAADVAKVEEYLNSFDKMYWGRHK